MKRKDTRKAIRDISAKEGITVKEVREEITLAMREGLSSRDPDVQERWRKIPCKGSVPTPEELIMYLVWHIAADTDPFT